MPAEAEADSPTRGGKRVRKLVVRRTSPTHAEGGGKPRRRVVVARRPRQDEDVASLSSTALSSPTARACRKGKDGKILGRSLLGDPNDFSIMERGDGPAVPRSPLGPTASPRSVAAARRRSSAHVPVMVPKRVEPPEEDERAKTTDRLGRLLARSSRARVQEQESKMSQLSDMTIADRTAVLREERALRRWNEVQGEWTRFRQRMAQQLGKPEEQLVVARADSFRQQMEEYDVLQKATPLHLKHGSEYWLMSLRGYGTRYVPIGNIFSGLFCPVKEDNDPMPESIRRPRIEPAPEHAPPDYSATHSWESSRSLQQRKKQLAQYITAMRPHELTQQLADRLVIRGADLLQWANDSTQSYFADLDVQQREAAASPEAEARAEAEAEARAEAEAARLAAEAAEAAAAAAELPTPGPHLTFEQAQPVRLLFEADVADVATGVAALSNSGTTALHFEWERVPLPRLLHAVEQDEEEEEEQEEEQPQRFFCHAQAGVLLPGDRREFLFTFASDKPGVFTEQWRLSTVPPTSADGAGHTVTLRAAAIQQDRLRLQRAALQGRIDKMLFTAGLKNVLRDVVNAVETPRRPGAKYLADEAAFTLQNGGRGLYYSREVHAAYEQLAAEIKPLVPELRDDWTWDSSVATLEALVLAAVGGEDDDAPLRPEESPQGAPPPSAPLPDVGPPPAKSPRTVRREAEEAAPGLAQRLRELTMRASARPVPAALESDLCREAVGDWVDAFVAAEAAAREAHGLEPDQELEPFPSPWSEEGAALAEAAAKEKKPPKDPQVLMLRELAAASDAALGDAMHGFEAAVERAHERARADVVAARQIPLASKAVLRDSDVEGQRVLLQADLDIADHLVVAAGGAGWRIDADLSQPGQLPPKVYAVASLVHDLIANGAMCVIVLSPLDHRRPTYNAEKLRRLSLGESVLPVESGVAESGVVESGVAAAEAGPDLHAIAQASAPTAEAGAEAATEAETAAEVTVVGGDDGQGQAAADQAEPPMTLLPAVAALSDVLEEEQVVYAATVEEAREFVRKLTPTGASASEIAQARGAARVIVLEHVGSQLVPLPPMEPPATDNAPPGEPNPLPMWDELEEMAAAKRKPPKPDLAKELSPIVDVVVSDDLLTAVHPEHSLTTLDAELRVAGPSLAGELRAFTQLLGAGEDIPRPLVAVVGGSNVDRRVALLDELIDRADEIVLGGTVAVAFAAAAGAPIGDSEVDDVVLPAVRRLMTKAARRGVPLHLPADYVIGDLSVYAPKPPPEIDSEDEDFEDEEEEDDEDDSDEEPPPKPIDQGEPYWGQLGETAARDGVPDGWRALDVGPETAAEFKAVVDRAGTVVWSGVLGACESAPFQTGTRSMLDAVIAATNERQALTVVTGGTVGLWVERFGGAGDVTHVSQGADFTRALLSGGFVPAIAALTDREPEVGYEIGEGVGEGEAVSE